MLARPAALTAADYRDPARLEAERRALFARHWQFVGFTDELSTPGSWLVREIAGEPVLVQDFDGELRALRNVCSHRFARLRAGEAGTDGGPLRCPYHGWTYDRDGVPVGIPGNRECFGLDREGKRALSLKRYELDRVGRFLFVRVMPGGPPLADWLGPQAGLLAALSDGMSAPFSQEAQPWDANWKVGVENVLEVYHVDAVHPDSFRTVVDGSWRVVPSGPHSVGYAGIRPEALRWWEGAGKRLGLMPVDALADVEGYVHLLLFPNLAIGVTAGRMMSVQTLEPTGPDSFTLRYRLCLANAREGASKAAMAAVTSHLAALNSQLLAEDRAVCAAVGAGLRHVDGAALLGVNEDRIRHFHDIIQGQMADTIP
ncbi:aromatic ring-hydroxylating oxygenase subunit alpha [Niveispirillum sp. KHB5.9]|uniref:aromatic ring-hydroxylating oxygenase subunit alpha n=1 Tax=Niveispirillum sp. KHB5.9 TaxID=3400269 RepID=UPI003A85D631